MHGSIPPKKALGQHFLTSEAAIEKTVAASGAAENDLVVEIGPGMGALTKALLSRGVRVIAIETDKRLAEHLSEEFASYLESGALSIIYTDAREVNFGALSGEEPYRIVANVPYYLTGVLLRQIFSTKKLPVAVSLVLQKEVAARIARSKKESILSLSVKYYGTPRYISTIKAGSFHPAPAVDSAILSITDISRTERGTEEEARFFEVVKAGFAQKRKKLQGNLSGVFPEGAAPRMEECGVATTARAEELTLEKWVCLAHRH